VFASRENFRDTNSAFKKIRNTSGIDPLRLTSATSKYSRKVVGWAISNSLETTLITEALRQAIERRRPSTNKRFYHSDRGCQYTSKAFQGLLKTMQITCSMRGTGFCYDKEVAERFFCSLKYEWTNNQTYRDLEVAKRSVFKYIELLRANNQTYRDLEVAKRSVFKYIELLRENPCKS
jgi:putative transposase